MKRLLIPLALWATPMPAMAQAPDVSGYYTLEGVMETGSELLLARDGRFQWYLVYGALDQFAEGTWTRTGDGVTLTASKDEKAPPPAFDTLVLGVSGKGLMPPDGRGVYVKGGDAPAVTPAEGDAAK